MTRIEMVDTAALTSSSEAQSEFEAIAQEIDKTENTNNQVYTETEDGNEPMLTDEEIADMIVTQGVINTSIRQMKESQERMKEILNEEV
ncbi:hypothetical protein GCM10007938_12330 [Vibrio zhanjiangensis]|uniref:Uncharacterized protein n=1 Tax=Vibrio zhanjiangensis TaxID=1046128 RepID=A0ABQ6EXL0_9VIBR|nr:hypothetical protein [Vibrio zhanjiangensis]GLT17456.1 hypothetical protein GCM10007938_12330 [Vibrio zhanjiangensis]